MGRGKEWQVKWWPGVYERLGVLPACRGGQRGCVRSSTCQRLALAPPINVLPGPGKSMLPRPRPRQGLVFFLGREVPREQLLFVIRSFGGEAAWDGEGSPFAEAHEGVTHQVGGRVARRAGGPLVTGAGAPVLPFTWGQLSYLGGRHGQLTQRTNAWAHTGTGPRCTPSGWRVLGTARASSLVSLCHWPSPVGPSVGCCAVPARVGDSAQASASHSTAVMAHIQSIVQPTQPRRLPGRHNQCAELSALSLLGL